MGSNKRPRCFIIQEPTKRTEKGVVPIMDFRPVLEYGEPVICLPPGRVGFTPGPTIDNLREILRDITPDDFLVSVGDPTAMFVAAMIVGDLNNGICKMLKWDKNSKRYIEVNIDIHYRTRGEKNVANT